MLIGITYKDVKIIMNEGFDFNIVVLEIYLTALLVYAVYYVTRSFRKSMLEW